MNKYNLPKSVRYLNVKSQVNMYADLIRNYKKQKIKNFYDNKMYLTGNYTTAFNYGKQDEVHNRVKHTGYME